jgi:6-phosphogluconolactonase
MNMLDYRPFEDGAQLANALAVAVADDLASAIIARGEATLAVSGGKTPLRFLEALSRQTLNWPKVAVTLVDERWAPPDDARSNEGFVRAHLLQGAAAAARFVPLYRAEAATPEQGARLAEAAIAKLALPFDALVLGMGEDGHTASFFADGDRFAAAIDPHTSARVASMRAPSAGEPRITLTLPAILASRALYLHIEGERKREVLESARHATDGSCPIAAVLRNTRTPIKVYWCPSLAPLPALRADLSREGRGEKI